MIDLLIRLDSVERHMRAVVGSIRPLTAEETQILYRAADEAERVIKDAWPVKTGFSRASWRVFVEDLGLRFFNGADYAQYVHYKGDPMLVWDQVLPIVDELVIEPLLIALTDAISRAGSTGLSLKDRRGNLRPAMRVPTRIEPVSLKPVRLNPVSLEPVSLEPVQLQPVSLDAITIKPVSLKPVRLNISGDT